MGQPIRNIVLLKRILWVDFLAGSLTAIIGLLGYRPLTAFLGLPAAIIVIIAAVTLVYAVVALTLSLQSPLSILLLRILVYANWIWAVISIGLLIVYLPGTTSWGAAFLVLQVIVVGLLGWLEGKQLN